MNSLEQLNDMDGQIIEKYLDLLEYMQRRETETAVEINALKGAHNIVCRRVERFKHVCGSLAARVNSLQQQINDINSFLHRTGGQDY